MMMSLLTAARMIEHSRSLVVLEIEPEELRYDPLA
jgi:hypothetical protein